MRTIVMRLATLAVLTFPMASSAQDLLDGIYEGTGQEGGTLRVIVDGRNTLISIKAAGCLGSVEGYLAKNRKDDLFLLSSTYKEDGCAVAVHKQGNFALSTKQGPECSSYHGAACSLNGYVERVR